MLQFINGPKDKFGNSKIVNLKAVSNIAFEAYINRFGVQEYKIIFNMGYPVSLKTDYKKLISDYVYFVYQDRDEYERTVDTLSGLINEHGWIAPLINGVVTRITNPDYISFISTDPRKNRIILNLSTSVSFYNNNERLTSDFIYLDFTSQQEYIENYAYIRAQLEKPF